MNEFPLLASFSRHNNGTGYDGGRQCGNGWNEFVEHWPELLVFSGLADEVEDATHALARYIEGDLNTE